jgi:hypothetical protein
MTTSYRTIDLVKVENLNLVGWFFRRETEKMSHDPLILEQPELFNRERWGQCAEAIVAEDGDEVVGVVTLAPGGIDGSGKPTLDTLYVTEHRRREGIGFALFVAGMKRLGGRNVYSLLRSSNMKGLVEKLPDDLAARLDADHAYKLG